MIAATGAAMAAPVRTAAGRASRTLPERAAPKATMATTNTELVMAMRTAIQRSWPMATSATVSGVASMAW